MKKTIHIAMATLTLLAGATAVSSQTRIRFARGARHATVTGTLTSYKQERVYLIHVAAGQKMTVEDVGNHAVSIYIEGPRGSDYVQDLAADCHGHTDIDSTSAGDYKITVQECQKVDRWRGTFKFKVTVR